MSTAKTKRTPGKIVAAARPVPKKPTAPASSPKRQPRSSKVEASFDLNSVVADVTSTFTKGLNRPLVLLSVVCVIALVVTHSSDFTSGVLGKWVAEKSTTNSLAKWVHENQARFLGLVIFLPALIDSPENVRVAVALASVFWVMLIPAASIYEYVVQAFALHTYFRVRLQGSRVLILVIVGVLYLLGHITLTSPQRTPM